MTNCEMIASLFLLFYGSFYIAVAITFFSLSSFGSLFELETFNNSARPHEYLVPVLTGIHKLFWWSLCIRYTNLKAVTVW